MPAVTGDLHNSTARHKQLQQSSFDRDALIARWGAAVLSKWSTLPVSATSVVYFRLSVAGCSTVAF
jgi:hypothetical protein